MGTAVVKYNPNLPLEIEWLLFGTDGQPTDLTGTTFRMHVRSKIESDTILAIASSDNNKIEIVSITATYKKQEFTADGIKISLTASDTLNIYQNGKNAVSDLEVTYPSGQVVPEIINFIFEPNLSNTRDFL